MGIHAAIASVRFVPLVNRQADALAVFMAGNLGFSASFSSQTNPETYSTSELMKQPVQTKSKPSFTHGGARVGAGRKRGIPNRWPAVLAKEIRRLGDEVEKLRQQRRLEGEHGERILVRLIAIERHLGLRDRIEVPRHSRRRPLGPD